MDEKRSARHLRLLEMWLVVRGRKVAVSYGDQHVPERSREAGGPEELLNFCFIFSAKCSFSVRGEVFHSSCSSSRGLINGAFIFGRKMG